MRASKTTLFTACALALAGLGFGAGAFASGQGMRADRDHLAVHTLEILDDHGVSRMTISGNQGNAVIDGVDAHVSRR